MTDLFSDYEFLICSECGIRWGMPSRFVVVRREGNPDERKNFYCPNGHSQIFKTTENDDLRRERDRLKQEHARLEDEVMEAERRARAAETRLRKAQQRTAAGVCPCCHRSFRQLAAHMKSRHPDVVPMKDRKLP